MRTLALVVLLALGACAGDVEEFTCDGTAGFQTAGADDASLSADGGHLVWAYDRQKMAPLAHSALMTEFTELTLTLRSDAAGTWVAVLKDRDGATFHRAFTLPAGTWTTVTLRPADFTLNHDSPVKKAALEPARLGTGWVLIDAAAIRKDATGTMQVRVDAVTVTRSAAVETAGEWAIEGEQAVRESRRHRGLVLLRRGSRLTVTAPRFELDGAFRIEDGATLVVAGSALSMRQRFNHERTHVIAGKGRAEFRDALVITGVPSKITLEGAGTLAFTGTECVGGFTVDVPPGATVDLRGAGAPGEFVIAPGGRVSVRDSRDVIVWLILGDNARGPLSVPGEVVTEPWTAGAGHDVSVVSSRGMRWGVISLPGSDATLRSSTLTAAGLLFGGKDAVTLEGLRNGAGMGTWKVPSPDRALTFEGTTVAAWNVYTTDSARVTVTRSTVGEVLGFGNGRAEVLDSTVDGTGGYVGASGRSELHLTRCRLTCLALARDDGLLVLTDCVVEGDVRAVDRARVRLVRTDVRGSLTADPGATLTRE